MSVFRNIDKSSLLFKYLYKIMVVSGGFARLVWLRVSVYYNIFILVDKI